MTDAPQSSTVSPDVEAASSAADRDYKDTLFLPQTDFPMRAGLPKAEPKILQRWEHLGVYQRLREKAKNETRETYTLHDGPPYANGNLHIGHALNKILKDLCTRTRQMAGYDAPYVPGWDCHGLPIEWKVEEAFRGKGKAKDDVDPVEFMRACRDYAGEWVAVQREEFKRLGVIGDWDNPYVTMDPATEAVIVGEFLKFVESGQVYRGSKPVMWSPVERTALAEAEVEYHDHQSHTIWVKFPVVTTRDEALAGASVVIWTTTPWTIPGNRAVSYGPDIAYGLYEVTAVDKVVDPKTGEEKDPWSKVGDRLVLADALAEGVFTAAKIADAKRLGAVSGEALGKTTLAHPLRGADGADGHYDFDVPLLSGGHVTDDAGTGFVHTAPSHGQEDFDVWMAHGLGQDNIPDMVDDSGAYYPHVALFAGEQVLRTSGKKTGQDGGANPAVIKALMAAGALLARGRLKHSYPHSWRSKAPLIYRNTPQWFIRMDHKSGEAAGGNSGVEGDSLRAKALHAIDEDVQWIPATGQNRIRNMIADRPDWLVSRQRHWGVPLTLIVDKATNTPLVDEAVNARIVDAIAQGGVEAWHATPLADFLGAGYAAADYDKVTDILDVWFDSGCTHAFTLEKRDGLPWPADLYLEGSDQHRGWFHSSLLEACGTRGRAPYKAVLTHGFTVDENGKKHSKSSGKALAPAAITQKYGAEIIRLWVTMADYTQDLRISDDILASAVESYRKIRNTVRYLLGALHGFTEEERVELADMPGLERFILHRLAQLDGQVRHAYGAYDFRAAFTALMNFCTNDLSAFYFDIRKDSLYCDAPDALRRRAARTVMDACLDRLMTWFAPSLTFTMDEAWVARHPGEASCVHLHDFFETPAEWRDDALAERFERIRRVRRVANGAIEVERRDKRIGSSLEAAPVVYVTDDADRAAFDTEAQAAGVPIEEYLAEITITSQASLVDGAAPDGAFAIEGVDGVGVVPAKAEGKRCARSWRIVPDVGTNPAYPDLSARDAAAVAAWDALAETS